MCLRRDSKVIVTLKRSIIIIPLFSADGRFQSCLKRVMLFYFFLSFHFGPYQINYFPTLQTRGRKFNTDGVLQFFFIEKHWTVDRTIRREEGKKGAGTRVLGWIDKPPLYRVTSDGVFN